MLHKRSQTQDIRRANLLHEVQEQAKPIYGDRDQNSGFLPRVSTGRGQGGALQMARNASYLDQGGPVGM